MRLTEEQTMIRDMARSFAQNELAPGAASRDEQASFPAEAIKQMGQLGLLGMTVPEDHGGTGTDFVSYMLALEEIAAGDGAASTIMAVQNSPCCSILQESGSASQQQLYLRPMAAGDMLGCFCLTEPHTGSDASAIRTRAERTDGGYRINGTKQFITTASHADVAIVFAVTDPDLGARGISAFLVPTDATGFSIGGIEKKLGQRSSDTCQVIFDNCEIDDSLRIGDEDRRRRCGLPNRPG